MKVSRGDVCLVDFGVATGREQAGVRPAIIIQNDVGNKVSPCTIVCPLTSKQKVNLPTHLSLNGEDGLKKKSVALCEQIQTIDKQKIIKTLGQINKDKIYELNKKIMASLGM